MKALHRTVPMVAFALTIATMLPAFAGAQRQRVPGPDTRRVLVTAFRGDPVAGVKAANEIRDRIESEFNIRELMPTSKRNIDTALAGSGYKPDSALSPNDIKELARIVRGDEIIDGAVLKGSGNSYRLSARMFLPRDVSLSQPLVTNLETTDFGDAAKQIVKEYDQARKQLKDNQECENGIRALKLTEAIASARKGIQNYPKSTLARLCLAQAYATMKTTADSTGPWKDSVLSVTKEVLALDKASLIAWRLQVDAYKNRKDTANIVNALLGYMNADPTNSTLREQVIAEVIGLGRADLAVPIAKTNVAENPGDPQYLRTYWLVLRAAKNYKESVPAGIAYASIDTSVADTAYFLRQIQDLADDSSYAKAAEMAASASAKFPRNTQFLLSKAQYERRAGQLPAAKASLERALSLDPKVPGANMVLAQIEYDLGNSAGAVAAVKADVAGDATKKDRDALFLLQMGQLAYKGFTGTKKPEDFKKAMDYLKGSDEVNASPEAAFYMAVSAFSMLQQVGEKLPQSHSCDEFKAASDLLSTVNINMPRGGRVNPQAAAQILGAVPQFSAFIDGSMKKYCK